jgi:hypothetical protein
MDSTDVLFCGLSLVHLARAVHYVSVRMGPWLMKVQSPQAGGGRDYGDAWSIGMPLAAVECGYVLGVTRQATGGVIALTVLADLAITHSLISSVAIVLAPGLSRCSAVGCWSLSTG